MHLRRWMCAGLSLALAGPAILAAQEGGAANAQKPFLPTQVSPADSLNALLNGLEIEVVGAAEAMPAEKYDFAPSTSMGEYKGVSTFGEQVKHLAEANYEFFHGWGLPNEVDPKTIATLKTKDDIVKALRTSYAYAHAAVNSVTPENAFMSVPGPANRKPTRASMVAFCMAHSMDHYGQLVEYLRMNGIIPPASRRPANRPQGNGSGE